MASYNTPGSMSSGVPQLPGTNPQQGGMMPQMPQAMGPTQDQPMPQEAMGGMAPTPPVSKAPNIDKLLEEANIAEHLDDEELKKIGDKVWEGYEQDRQSKQQWDQHVDDWVKLAAQVKEEKSWPWPKAANVKYPLLSTASLQFQARAYPALIPADGKIVQMKVVGVDQKGMKADKADRLATHMNYQLLQDMEGWEEEMDRLLIMLPIVGCLFKKTYWDSIKKKNCSRLLSPKDLVVNYYAPSLEGAYRVTEVIQMTKNKLKSMQIAELYLEPEDLPEPRQLPSMPTKVDVHQNEAPSKLDDTVPYVILEQHTYLDLDDDGYAEPYIVTIEEQSKKVLRVVARWDSDGVYQNDDGDVICIEPVQYYTKYEFIPNPDGGFYGVGFGHLLGPLNDSANTIINQLIDAGTLSNLQSGFIGKSLKLKMGDNRFQPGEWKAVPATGDDIKKQIYPLPTKEPSKVLFELLGMIVESSEKLASVAEIFVGKMPGQNTPATTTMATIEQGMKVFTAIYKRVYRSLTSEFKKIFRLNGLYPENIEKAQHVLDAPISVEDYDNKSYDVCPTADPTAVSSTQKLLKAQGLMELLQLGTLNVMEVTKRILEAQEQPNIEGLLLQQPTPNPEMAKLQAEMQMKQQDHQMEMVSKQMDLQFKQQEALMDQKFMAMEKQMEFKLKEMEFQQKAQHQVRQSQLDMMTGAQDLQTGQMEHQATMEQSQQKHDLTMKQAKDKAALQKEQMNAKANQQGRNSGVAKPSGNSKA